MRVLVLGHTGMLGRYVYTYLKGCGFVVEGFSRDVLDAQLVTMNMLEDSLCASPGDVVINCIGLVKQRADISDLSFIMVNTVLPQMLATYCNSRGAKLIHPSSDCCFSGGRPFDTYPDNFPESYEDDELTDAKDMYGRTKALGEPRSQTVIRTSIIGEELKNKLSLIEWVKSQDNHTINGYTNHHWNGITCLQFAKVCEQIINEDLFWPGPKHITSPEKVSKYDLVKLIIDTYALSIYVNPVAPGKNCNRTLAPSNINTVFNIPSLKQQLIEQRDFYSTLKGEELC